MTTSTLAVQLTEAFGMHEKFTAKAVQAGLAVEVRYADSGRVAAEVWLPDADQLGEWWWELPGRPATTRTLPGDRGIDEVVRAVATSALDERGRS